MEGTSGKHSVQGSFWSSATFRVKSGFSGTCLVFKDVASTTPLGTVPEFIQSHCETKDGLNRGGSSFVSFLPPPFLVLVIFTRVGENSAFSPKTQTTSMFVTYYRKKENSETQLQ